MRRGGVLGHYECRVTMRIRYLLKKYKFLKIILIGAKECFIFKLFNENDTSHRIAYVYLKKIFIRIVNIKTFKFVFLNLFFKLQEIRFIY